MRFKAHGNIEKLYDMNKMEYSKSIRKAEQNQRKIAQTTRSKDGEDSVEEQPIDSYNTLPAHIQERNDFKEQKIQNFKIKHNFAKKLRPDLHTKTHFKAAMSMMMKDSKIMNFDDGSVNEVIKQAISSRQENLLGDSITLNQ